MDVLRLRTVGVSFGVSLGVHGLFFALLVTSFSRATARTPLMVPRVRLVYVDPAPAAAPPRGTVAGVAVPAPVPVAPVVPAEPAAVQPVPTVAKKLVRSAKKVEQPPPPPVAAPAPVQAPPVETTAVPPAGVAEGIAGAPGDTPGGSAAGVEGGRVGGSGAELLRLGDVDVAPVLVTRVVPEYPRRARLAGIEGEVVLEVVVDRYGRVGSDVRVVAAVPELEAPAIAAVRRWRFRPARDRRGEVVAVLMEVPVRFVLHEATAVTAR